MMINGCIATRLISDNCIKINFKFLSEVYDKKNYRFDLLRSNSQSGEYKTVFTNIVNEECKDYSANLLNYEIKYYYKIKCISSTNDEYITDSFSAYDSDGDEYTFAINEMYTLYLNDVISNNSFKHLKMMKSGVTCHCYDDVRNSSYEGECDTCFGTNFIGGFYPSVDIKLSFYNSPSYQEEMVISGTFENIAPLQCWTLGYPLIQEGDLIIDSDKNIRFRVASVQVSHKNGKVIRQTMQINKIPESNLLYKVKF